MPRLPRPIPVQDYHTLALQLYARLYGRRCTNCHDLVDLANDGLIHEAPGELFLTHRACAD